MSGCHTIVPDRREEKETGKSQSKTQAQNAQPEAVSREDEGSAVMSLHKLSSAMATRVGWGGGSTVSAQKLALTVYNNRY